MMSFESPAVLNRSLDDNLDCPCRETDASVADEKRVVLGMVVVSLN